MRPGPKPSHQWPVGEELLNGVSNGWWWSKQRFWVIRRSRTSNATVAKIIILFTEWVRQHEACDDKINARLCWGLGPFSQPSRHTVLSQLPQVSAMEAKSQRPEEREGIILALNAAIEAMNLAKELSSITPAGAVFGSVSVVLTMIKVSLLLVFC